MAQTVVKGLVCGFLAIVLAGCIARSTPFVDDAGNPILSPPIPQDSNKAVIFFYRPPRLGRAAVSAPVIVSSKKDLLVGRLPNASYTWMTMPAGKYEFKTGFPSLTGEERSTTSLAVDAGQKYYVRVLIERFSSEVSSVPAAEAEEEMKSTQYIRPTQEHFISE